MDTGLRVIIRVIIAVGINRDEASAAIVTGIDRNNGAARLVLYDFNCRPVVGIVDRRLCWSANGLC